MKSLKKKSEYVMSFSKFWSACYLMMIFIDTWEKYFVLGNAQGPIEYRFSTSTAGRMLMFYYNFEQEWEKKFLCVIQGGMWNTVKSVVFVLKNCHNLSRSS